MPWIVSGLRVDRTTSPGRILGVQQRVELLQHDAKKIGRKIPILCQKCARLSPKRREMTGKIGKE